MTKTTDKKQKEKLNFKYVEYELKLGELISKREVIEYFYSNVDRWPENFEIWTRVLKPIDEIMNMHDKKLAELRKRIKEEGKETINKEYNDFLNDKITINIALLEQKYLEKLQLTPSQISVIENFVV